MSESLLVGGRYNTAMFDTSASVSIAEIVTWLKGEDQDEWPEQVNKAEEAESTVVRMSASAPRNDKGSRQIVHGDEKMRLAKPHVQAMLRAMRRKDRRSALQHGEAALKAFS